MFDENNRMPFDFPSPTSCIIKVIGVGGGGGNAVNHMYKEGIHDVAFVVCNTDSKALEESPVPVKLQLGHEGLGAGNRPQKAKEATEESLAEVQNMLSDGTKMVFITAGMGGGTGTGAAPLIAKVAKDMDILTVGIVTIPFRWEGDKKIDQALDGVEEISKNVDALLVINNEKLSEIYSDLSLDDAFDRADDTLSVAAKSIAEIITMRGKVNLDFNDVKTVLKDGGVAIMSTGYGEGENRVTTAIQNAQHSPLLNNNDIFKSKKVLLNISYSSEKKLMMSEMDEVKEFMNRFNREFETKFGIAIDDSLGSQVKITLLATGFGVQDIHMKEMDDRIVKRTIEEEKRKAEQEEKDEERRIRREGFYGKDNNTKIRGKRRRNIHIFTMEDLDNDNVISMVETVPTFKRSKDMLENIQAKVTSDDDQFNSYAGNKNENENVITFNND
ncbi:MAG: cell division protein FtsZ [Bacteroidaceae bacterium]|nr:cell division protein FtsZ [Bacteroidaceae bacterium]